MRGRLSARSTLISELVEANDGSSVSGSSAPSETCRTPLGSIGPDAPDGAAPDASALALEDGASDAPVPVDGAVVGAVDVVAPPHAAAMTAMLAKMPSNRFCIESPPNGNLTRCLATAACPHIPTPQPFSLVSGS